MVTTVVIDKNFLQGASRDEVHLLMDTHQLVMPGALFFELMTTDVVARKRCFSKLSSVVNPVYLVDSIGGLLRYEISEKRPCGLPSTHRLKLNFQFNKELSDDSYDLPEDAKITIDSKILEVAEDAATLIYLSEIIPEIFPGLLAGTSEQREANMASVEAQIANTEIVHEFYTLLDSPNLLMPYPRIQADFESWAHIRWLQVKLLFSTHLYFRYQGRLRENVTPKILTKLEHDVHDAQILVLGVMEGALVTRENKLQRWFRLLQPDGWVSTGIAEPKV